MSFFEENFYNQLPIAHELTLTTVQDQKRVEIRNNGDQFVIHSSDNPDSYFSSDSTGVFKDLILDLNALLN